MSINYFFESTLLIVVVVVAWRCPCSSRSSAIGIAFFSIGPIEAGQLSVSQASRATLRFLDGLVPRNESFQRRNLRILRGDACHALL